MQFEFQGQCGAACGWLHVDAGTLQEHAARAGWQRAVIIAEEDGNDLAELHAHHKGEAP